MKINSYQSCKNTNVKFTSLYGELPKELDALKSGFIKHADEFMKDKPGYDVVLSTTKNNKSLKIKGSAGFTFLEKAKTKKAISQIKSLQDLKDMLHDNYLTIQAGQEVLEEIGKVGKLFSIH